MHKPEELYLDLMKKALSYTMWTEPPRIVRPLKVHSPIRRKIIHAVSKFLASKQLVLAKITTVTESDREHGRVWPQQAHTMIGMKRLDNIQYCMETALANRIPGDFIETGVWRGGSCIFMRAVLAAYGVSERKVFVADSFEGLPKPDADRYPADANDPHHTFEELAVSKEEVEENFRKYGLLDDQVVFLKGWFKDTLPRAPIEQLAVMRLDGDMYESTMDALRNLYPKLSPGGYCIIDDYFLQGCKKAVDDYRRDNKISADLQVIDWSSCFWKKEE